MTDFSFFPIVFYLLALLTVLSAAGVAFSNNIVYSAFALMGTLLGAAGLFVLLAADFVAVIQVLIYVGGILVLMLFAVMLTHRIADVHVSNRAVGRLPGLVVVGVVFVWRVRVAITDWHQADACRRRRPMDRRRPAHHVRAAVRACPIVLRRADGAVVLSRKSSRTRAHDVGLTHFLTVSLLFSCSGSSACSRAATPSAS
jgi:NADH-quinone oxidoreductase subunit J